MKYGIMPDLTEEEVLDFKVNYDPETKAKQKLLASFILDPETHYEYLRRVLIQYNKIYNSWKRFAIFQKSDILINRMKNIFT